MRGSVPSPWYFCADIKGDFRAQYERFYVPCLDGLVFPYGAMVYRNDAVVQAVLEDSGATFCQDTIVEVHGIAIGKVNVGVYVWDDAELHNSALEVQFRAWHVGESILDWRGTDGLDVSREVVQQCRAVSLAA
jgi:hypothetical protein